MLLHHLQSQKGMSHDFFFFFNENADLLFIIIELNEKFQRLTWLNKFIV